MTTTPPEKPLNEDPAYDKSVQLKWYERIIGPIIAFLMGRW